MSYPAAFAHARSGNDDNSRHPVELLRFRRVLDEPDVGPFQHVGSAVAVTHDRHGHFLCQRGIQKNIYRREPLGFKQCIEIFEYRLRAFQSECRDEQIAR